MNHAEIAARLVLEVPAEREAHALPDQCQHCEEMNYPATVLRDNASTTPGRYGTYQCFACRYSWICWWTTPDKWEDRP